MAEERKVALVTGITGQDGSYLAELLLEKGYTVSHLPNDNVLLLSSLSSALFPGKNGRAMEIITQWAFEAKIIWENVPFP
jgi:nucleoside-diphosphate-sugar epimerase